MADPIGYDRDYSFSSFQANAPATPLPGQQVDIQFDKVSASITTIVDAIRDVRRADGKLRNGIVTAESLSPDLALGVRPPAEWQAGVEYKAGDTVFAGIGFYRALVDHVSTDFAANLAAGLWELIADMSQIIANSTITDANVYTPTSAGDPDAVKATKISFLQAGTDAVYRTVQDKLRDVVSVKDFGAVGDGVTDDTAAINNASAAVAAAGGGEVVFPNGQYNFTFTKPPYQVTWSFQGTDITREKLGGSGTNVRFLRPKLTYIDGPHATDQVQVEHHRVLAKGSNNIGAQYADYAMGITIEKEHWSEKSGTPVAGEINCLTLFQRNGCVTGDPVKTGGAGILANLGQTKGSGYTQLLEAVNSVFTKGTLEVEKQTNIQILGIDERDNYSYGIVLNSNVGNQTSAIRVKSETTSSWTKILDAWIGAVNNFFIDVAGRIRWRVNGVSMSLGQDNTTSAVVFRNEAGAAMLYATASGHAGLRAVNVQTGTTYTINTTEISGDLGKTVVFANASPITVTLPNNAPVGFHFEAIQRDSGQVTFTPASGATLQNVNSHTKTQGQHAVVHLRVRANSNGSSAVWVMDGATAA